MASFVYYCDESSFHDTHMAVAGLAVSQGMVPEILSQITAINQRCKIQNEVKWENAKPRRQNAHEAYIDLLFELIKKNHAHFHVRFAPFDDYDHSLSGRNKRQDTVGKMHYQLILHRPVKYYGADNQLIIHPDNGTCTAKLSSMRVHLNADGKQKHGHKDNCITHIQCKNSKHEPMLQLLDVSLGALTAYKNGRHLKPDTSEVKKRLAEHAFAKTKLTSLDKNTPINSRKMNVWCAVPQWEKEK
jgi:hypothetical protein